jgi:DNA-binding NtrC family response regulator/tetratricopeptide (TPR) repeat protein
VWTKLANQIKERRMSLTYEAAQKLVDSGEFGELRKHAERLLDARPTLEPRLRVLIAHALVHTGEGQRALSLLSTVDLESRAGHWSRWRGHLVMGLAKRAVGSMTAALSDLQRAVHLAQESGTLEEIAWAHIYLFRHMVDGHPIDLAPAMLPAVRTAVTKAGVASASAFLHTSVAVLEGHNGRLSEALRHCECSESLVRMAPNAWLACGNQQNRAAILLADCRFAEALPILEALHEATTRHGLHHERAKAAANLGHLYTMMGEHDKALAALSDAANSPSISRLSRLSVCEGMARAYLGKGAWTDCENMLEQIARAAAADEGLANAYGVRWAAATKARLLLRLGRTAEAADHLEIVERRYSKTADAPFAAAVGTLAAIASTRMGRESDAARHLAHADQAGVTSFHELQGQFYGAVATITKQADPGLASRLASRAVRVWQGQGSGWMAQELDSSLQSIGGDGGGMSPGEAINALAGAIDVAYSPRLLGEELASLVRDLGCSDVQPLLTHRAAGQSETTTGQLLSLGTVDGQSWSMECQPPKDPLHAIVLSDVLRIGRAAVTLNRLLTAERNKAAFWPADQNAENDGALFLSPDMLDLVETAKRIAPTDIPVLITGETGTGKEVLARLIHSRSSRSKQALVPFNCTTIPREMMDSQLFGHRRGAFTGANESFQGVIRGARGGTLLLDEVGDLSLDAQPKLLRFLESGEVLPLGESSPINVDVRVIAATNANLDAAVSSGKFREDLYYRLNIIHLRIPPLRERRVEIPGLARHYLRQGAVQLKKGELQLSDEALEYMVLFDWPGNVRQLANEMRRVAALAEPDEVVAPNRLSSEIFKTSRSPGQVPTLTSGTNQIVVKLDQRMDVAVELLERAMLQSAMERHQGVEAVAKALGLSRKGLYLKRQRYGLLSASI